ncbi:MAG: M13 family metallopeptidase [Mycobacteriales bacterium]
MATTTRSEPDGSKGYYEEEAYAGVRKAFTAHVERMLTLAGVDAAADRADRVLALEIEVAAQHWTRVDSRDRDKTNNRTRRDALDTLAPQVDWSGYVRALGAPDPILETTIVCQPSFFAALSDLLAPERLDDWKDWLRWRSVHDLADYSPQAFVDEDFDFYGRTLSGTPRQRDRWKRGVDVVESAMPEALGEIYVQRHFPARARERTDELVANLIEAYRRSISGRPWMGEETRVKALDKLAQFTPKIGHPKKWRDYSRLEIDPADLVGNIRRASAFETDRQVAKIGQPVDRDEWLMSPQTVNAYYNPGQNEIVFPAAILQPPFFDADADDATNYGAIGAVIGHEIGHGFDDQGSKYDGTGALRSWWTAEDRSAFEERTGQLIAQYDALEPAAAPGSHVNGALTIGENIGDVGGLGIAHLAWRLASGGNAGAAAERRFFRAWATIWRVKVRPEEAVRLLAVDPHSPGEFRCNQVVRNIDAFSAAYGVGADDPMRLEPTERVRIW